MLAAVAIAMMARAAAASDLVVVSQITTPRSGTRTQTQYLSSTRFRLDDGEQDTIVDLASGRVTLVNDRRKEYSETSLDDLRSFLDEMEGAMAGRPLFDRSIGTTASVTLQKGQGARQIAGYETDPYTLTMGDSMKVDVWVAPAIHPPARYFEARKVPYVVMGPMLGGRFDRILDALEKIGGLPLAMTVDYRMRTVRRQVTTEATEVRTETIAGPMFAVPPEYKKVESALGRSGPRDRAAPSDSPR
jgi:hypothetical protein